ncbi:hypothetical protein ACA910_009378 [Epithemia clementina (nom. ined.)]
MERTGDNMTQSHHHGDGFLALPDGALIAIISRLEANDIFCLCQAIPQIKKQASHVVGQVLRDECLPGDNIEDFMSHFLKLEEYKKKLVKSLVAIAPGASDQDEQSSKQSVRKFLLEAIGNYACFVSGAHSWSEKLPMGVGEKFEFFFDLMANWRLINRREWKKKVQGDGSKFHYTWRSTDEYHSKYGLFRYRTSYAYYYYCSSDELGGPLKLRDDIHDELYIPRSALGPAVDVTAAVHRYAIAHNLYVHVLKAAVESGRPSIVHEDLQPRMFCYEQRLYKNSKGMRLPSAVAAALETAAIELLGSGGTEYEPVAERVIIDQQERERLSIALSLRDMCLRNLGKEITPSIEDVCSLARSGALRCDIIE